MEHYRIQDKQNATRGGRVTVFKIFERDGDAFIYQGTFTARGHNATDARCIDAYIESAERDEA